MSILADLLNAKEPLLNLALRQLEDYTHRPGVDAALIGEMVQKANTRARQLGLHGDYTGRELYQALINRVEEDNARLAKKIGGKNPDDLYEMIPLIKEAVAGIDMPRNAWVIKEEVAREMLRKMPPPNIMKLLGRRKVEALLKQEDLYEVYGALRFAEDGDWLNEFIELYKDLTPGDFETRQIKVVSYDAKKWGDIAEHFIEKKLHNITHLKELGVIMTMPVTKDSSMSGKGITLKVMPLLLHYYNEIRLYSAFFKMIKGKANFGELVVDTLIADTPNTSLIDGEEVNWRVIQRYYGKLPDESHPEMFEPHVHPEDLHWRKAEDIIYEYDPEMKFWQDMDYVGVIKDGDIVTLNLMDVALSYANGLEYQDRYIYHFRESLWNEIFIRYMGRANLEDRILMRLDNEMIRPKEIKLKKQKAGTRS